jgi:hypothetical protein
MSLYWKNVLVAVSVMAIAALLGYAVVVQILAK